MPETPATTMLLVVAAVLLVSGGALAQERLGVGENDVRDEPNHVNDANGFEDEDPFWSPKDDALVLDGYTEYTFGAVVSEDVSNLQNVLVHGQDTDSYEHHIYPGKTYFAAWWGHWSDTGGGGDLQARYGPTNASASGTAFVGEANGAIDDADDCSDTVWDEFVWRGNNGCAEDAGIPSAHEPADQMFAFVQPGTHDMHINTLYFGCQCPTDATFSTGADKWYQADFIYEDLGQAWRNANGFARYHYDSSTFITTQVVTSVNPEEITRPESGTSFDPYSGASGATHAHDVDVYTTFHPALEEAYRATVWNPPQDHGDDDEETNLVSERGPKGVLKEEQPLDDVEARLVETSSGVQGPAFPARGAANDLVFGPWKHEPNTADDLYLDKDNDTLVTYDGHNTYGGLDGDYYGNPDAASDYTSYKAGEHFWVDAKVGINTFPVWAGVYYYGSYAHSTPELPATGDPVASTLEEGDDNTQGPGLLYVHANLGTWYDKNQDNWIGDASEPEWDPDDGGTDTAVAASNGHDVYNHGTQDDPNQYTSDEFRGTCSADVSTVLIPTEDTDGDGVGEWGSTGVYKVSWGDGNPYSDAAMDVAGDTLQPVGDQVRGNVPLGSYVMPDDGNGQLSRYRTEGPIELNGWFCSSVEFGAGDWDNGVGVVFPTGNLDAPFQAVTRANLTDEGRVSKFGDNEGDPLAGAHVRDVDSFPSILGSGSS